MLHPCRSSDKPQPASNPAVLLSLPARACLCILDHHAGLHQLLADLVCVGVLAAPAGLLPAGDALLNLSFAQGLHQNGARGSAAGFCAEFSASLQHCMVLCCGPFPDEAEL